MTPTVVKVFGASTSAAIAPAAPVRISVRNPLSSRIATGIPVAASNTAISPDPLGSPRAGLL
jgi:hypothetical protein